jgi:hypothetical protein
MTDLASNANAGDNRAVDLASPEYQSFSAPAALAFALSLLSPLALATPLMMAAPAAAIGLAILALAKIRASDGALTGVKIARWAIAIALACSVATFVRGPVRNMLMRRQTAEVARVWLTQLAEGQIVEARTLLSGQADHSLGPPSGGPDSPPPQPEAVTAVVLERLGNEPLTGALAAMKRPLSVSLDPSTAEPPVFDGARTLLAGTYVVTPAGDGAPLRVQLTFVRAAFYETEGRPWRIERWSIAAEPSEAADAGSPSS